MPQANWISKEKQYQISSVLITKKLNTGKTEEFFSFRYTFSFHIWKKMENSLIASQPQAQTCFE